MTTGESVLRFEGHTGWVWSCAVSSDGGLALSGGDDCAMRFWDVATGEVHRRTFILGGAGISFTSLAIVPTPNVWRHVQWVLPGQRRVDSVPLIMPFEANPAVGPLPATGIWRREQHLAP